MNALLKYLAIVILWIAASFIGMFIGLSSYKACPKQCTLERLKRWHDNGVQECITNMKIRKDFDCRLLLLNGEAQ